jgi:threonine synthase
MGRMSPFQQAQMFSLMDANIHNLAVEGVFDDCQDIVKAVSSDLEFKRRYRIGTVNSINWARLVAQVVYYFAGYFQATTTNAQKVASRALGQLRQCLRRPCGAHDGPADRHLVVATNENDVLDEFFRTGVYRVRSSADTHETSSPSMDISKASNFERFVFDLLGRDAAAGACLFERQLREQGRFDLSRHPAFADAAAGVRIRQRRSTHADRLATIRDTDARFGQVIDTHTADGLKVARPTCPTACR